MLCKFHPKCKKNNCRFSHPIDKKVNSTFSEYINTKLSLNEESYIKNNVLIYENNFFNIFNNIKSIDIIDEYVIDDIIDNINSISSLLISKLEILKTYKYTPKRETFDKDEINMNSLKTENKCLKNDDENIVFVEKENKLPTHIVKKSVTDNNCISSFSSVYNTKLDMNTNNEIRNNLILPNIDNFENKLENKNNVIVDKEKEIIMDNLKINSNFKKNDKINNKLSSNFDLDNDEKKDKIPNRSNKKVSLKDKINNTIKKIKNYMKKNISKDDELNNKIYKNNRDTINLYSDIYKKYIDNIIDKKELKKIQILNFSRFINIMSIFYELSQNIEIMNSKILFNYWSFKDLGKNEIIPEILNLIQN